ncbi:MAG: hypothetical protein QOJ50_362 [Cryptosporangiaceae bacterium]|nr:hypothetical protein [Cryptosporangiaceae bacterium]
MHVSPISPTPAYSAPLARKDEEEPHIPVSGSHPAASSQFSAESATAAAEKTRTATASAIYLSKSDRDAVFVSTGQRIAPDQQPIPPIALQIAAERRASGPYAPPQVVAEAFTENEPKAAVTAVQGLDVVA